jgi:hypothetical protein
MPKKWKRNMALFSHIPFLYSWYSYSRLIESSFVRAKEVILHEGGALKNERFQIRQQVPEGPKIIERFGKKTIQRIQTENECAGEK